MSNEVMLIVFTAILLVMIGVERVLCGRVLRDAKRECKKAQDLLDQVKSKLTERDHNDNP